MLSEYKLSREERREALDKLRSEIDSVQENQTEVPYINAQDQYNRNTDSYIQTAEMWYDRATDNLEIKFGSIDAVPFETKLRLAEIAAQIAKARGLRKGL